VRSYPDGTKLLIQGTSNDTLFAIIEGAARVTKRAPSSAAQDVAILGPSGVFGEISALAKGETTADVVTLGTTICLELEAKVFEGLDVKQLMEQILVGHFVSCSPTFRNLPKEVINLVMRRGTLARLKPGEIVFEEGSIGHSLYLVVHGAVEVLHSGRPVKKLSQGDFFGEIAVMAQVPRTATIRASEECVLLRLESDAFWEILAENTQFSLFIESIAELRERDSELLKAAA
jgi:cAMP-dependent protein kinase regulator